MKKLTERERFDFWQGIRSAPHGTLVRFDMASVVQRHLAQASARVKRSRTKSEGGAK